jgi:hypothetical protein
MKKIFQRTQNALVDSNLSITSKEGLFLENLFLLLKKVLRRDLIEVS